MAGDAVLYMRGRFPFEVGNTISSEILVNLRVLLAVDDSQLAAIAQELESFSSFLDRRTVELIVGNQGIVESQASALVQLIISTDRLLREAEGTKEQLLSRIAGFARNEENKRLGQWSEDDISQMLSRLQIIMRPYSGLALQAKAQRLSEATGTQLERLEVICDLRPIFDENRERIQGVIPFTILKVVCKGVDGLPVSFEAILSARQVDELANKAIAANKKLDRLRELLADKILSVPSLDITLKGE